MRIFRWLALLAGAVCVMPVLPLIAETVRERASLHFAMISWSTDPSSVPAVASVAIEAAGGTETFPALTPMGDSGLPAVYPEIASLGPLDYSGIDGDLLALLSTVSSSLRARSLPVALCDPSRPFLSVMTNFRLERLTDPVSVFFSRPASVRAPELEVTESDDAALEVANGVTDTLVSGLLVSESSPLSSVFYLSCPSDEGPKPVLIEITFSKPTQAWHIEDISIDGGTYAAATQQD